MDLALIGCRIKNARTKQRLTLEKLSEMVGISRNFLWEIEAGRKAPAMQTFYNICKEINVSADYLFGFSSSYALSGKEENEEIISRIYDMIDSFDTKEIMMLYELLKTYSNYKKY